MAATITKIQSEPISEVRVYKSKEGKFYMTDQNHVFLELRDDGIYRGEQELVKSEWRREFDHEFGYRVSTAFKHGDIVNIRTLPELDHAAPLHSPTRIIESRVIPKEQWDGIAVEISQKSKAYWGRRAEIHGKYDGQRADIRMRAGEEIKTVDEREKQDMAVLGESPNLEERLKQLL